MYAKAYYNAFTPVEIIVSPKSSFLFSQQKFFDSGDYNMTKDKIGHKPNLSATEKTLLTESTGNAIPTADAVHKKVTQRMSSLVADEPSSPSHTD